MPKITVEHVYAKKIISKLKNQEVKFTTTSDSSEARNTMPTSYSAGTNGLGVKTTIKVHQKDSKIFDDICRSSLGYIKEQEVPEGKTLRETWPFKMFFRNK